MKCNPSSVGKPRACTRSTECPRAAINKHATLIIRCLVLRVRRCYNLTQSAPHMRICNPFRVNSTLESGTQNTTRHKTNLKETRILSESEDVYMCYLGGEVHYRVGGFG